MCTQKMMRKDCLMSKIDLYKGGCLECGCGGGDDIHELGKDGCFREIVPKSEEPKPFGVDKLRWKLPKQRPISDFTLKQQRGYTFHKEQKRWSKPKDRGSEWFESKGWD